MYKPETEYYLGQNERNGYTIVEHNAHKLALQGRCVFGVVIFGFPTVMGHRPNMMTRTWK